MSASIDYYFTPASPWSYLGHARLVEMAHAARARVALRPIDLGKVFPISGGLPLPKRAPQRQAYRLVELKRFSEHLGVPMNLRPKHFPVSGDGAARVALAIDAHEGSDAALAFTGAAMRAVWAEERDIADAAVLAALLAESSLPAQRLDDANAPATQAAYDASTQHAIDAGVFGAPCYVVDGEMFWGQDRLEFVQRKLQRA